MLDTGLITLILGVLATIVSPLLLSYLTGRQRHKEQKQDWARQDEVAKRLAKRQDDVAVQAAEVAKLLSDRQDNAAAEAANTARLLLAANERVAAQTEQVAVQSAEANEITAGKLNQIHELVNSTLTAAMQSELVALQQQLALMSELKRPEYVIHDVKERIHELTVRLADRTKQTELADAQVKKISTATPTALS